MFDGQLFLGAMMIVANVVFHVMGLVLLATLLKRTNNITQRFRPWLGSICLLAMGVLTLIVIHMVEAFGWAALYYYLGEFTDLKRALYFSIVTATTLGYGDITLSERWQLLSTFEAMGGLILFGASTAFLIDLMRQLLKAVFNTAESNKEIT